MDNFNKKQRQKLFWVLSNNDQHLILFYLHTGNGGEFKNKMMENYLKENNIDHITIGLYNPKHQEAVEVFYKTIQDFLY